MIKFVVFCFTLLCLNVLYAEPAVTYLFSGGRFGDNLLSYLHAKWIAYYYQIPLMYVPFSYSSELELDEEEQQNHQFTEFKNRINLNGFPHPAQVTHSTLLICPYFPEVEWERKTHHYVHFNVDWKNKEYRKIVHEMIQPKAPLQLIHPPKDITSIAIHIREGGGYDSNRCNLEHPLKLPPLSFYIDSLLQVIDLLKGKRLYCHIFTDYKQPKELVDKIKQKMPSDASIAFNYRENGNHHNINVLEDFFSLFNFDILIRPESNFSIIPSLIHDYAIVCYPTTPSINNMTVTINGIKIVIDDDLFRNCLIR